MKILKLLVVFFSLTFLMSSCFLFKKKHERCPAYGTNEMKSEQHDQIDAQPTALGQDEDLG